MVLVRKWSDSIGLCFGSLPYVVPPRQYRIHGLLEKHGGILWNFMGLRLRNDTAMHLDHCRTAQLRLITWQYWIDWHHDRQIYSLAMHEFKVGSESGRCCIIAITSLRLSETKKRHWMTRGRCARAQNSQAQKTIWTTVTNHIAIRTSALWDWYVRSEKSSRNYVKFVALLSMENMIPARC